MSFAKGWINRQFAQLEKDFATWPEWMKRGVTLQSPAEEEKSNMPYFVVSSELPRYHYDVIEAPTQEEAVERWEAAAVKDGVASVSLYSHITETELSHTPDYDSGPWSTLELAQQAAEEGGSASGNNDDTPVSLQLTKKELGQISKSLQILISLGLGTSREVSLSEVDRLLERIESGEIVEEL